MASTEAVYFKVPLADVVLRCTASRVFKVGVALGGSCLVLLGIMAVSSSNPELLGINSSMDEPTTNLFGLTSSSLRGPSPMISQMAKQLPGHTPFKELALATMQAANGCVGDVSTNAMNNANAALSSMSSTDKNVVAKAAGAVESKAKELLKAGQVAPLGFWDPFSLSAGASEGRLLFYREAEIKHGRVCMLAVLGTVVQEKLTPMFSGSPDFSAIQSFSAQAPVGYETFWKAAFLQNIITIAFLELRSLATISIPDNAKYEDMNQDGQDAFSMKDLNRVPGDLGFDPLGLKPKTEKDLLSIQNKEILNGRLAMIAAMGILAQELVTGGKIVS